MSGVDSLFIRKCMDELERRNSGDEVQQVYDKVCEGMPGGEGEVRRGVISALLALRDNNALYFIVRALLLQLISSGIFLVALYLLNTINFFQAILLGIAIFISSLALSKLLDSQLRKATKSIIRYLDSHERLKGMILRNF